MVGNGPACLVVAVVAVDRTGTWFGSLSIGLERHSYHLSRLLGEAFGEAVGTQYCPRLAEC